MNFFLSGVSKVTALEKDVPAVEMFSSKVFLVSGYEYMNCVVSDKGWNKVSWM